MQHLNPALWPGDGGGGGGGSKRTTVEKNRLRFIHCSESHEWSWICSQWTQGHVQFESSQSSVPGSGLRQTPVTNSIMNFTDVTALAHLIRTPRYSQVMRRGWNKQKKEDIDLNPKAGVAAPRISKCKTLIYNILGGGQEHCSVGFLNWKNKSWAPDRVSSPAKICNISP